MKRSLAFVYVFGLFVLGILVGALAMYLIQVRRDVLLPPFLDGGERHERFFFDRLSRHLNLTDEQEFQIQEIIENSRAEALALHDELLPRLEAHMERTRERIEAVLTPEQRERFEDLERSHRKWAEHFLLGRGHGRPFRRHRPGPPPGAGEPPASPPGAETP